MSDDVFFSTIAIVIIPFIVAAILRLAESVGLVWAKVNQPAIAGMVGMVLGAIYHVESFYMYLHSTKPTGTVADFIIGGLFVGLGGSGLKSLYKDARSGALTATSEEDIYQMRKSGNGRIGS